MPQDSPNINAFWSRIIVEEFVRCGITTFCISPGSRSTPLTLAAAENARCETIVHFDERGTAFHALGIAKSSGRPCVFICTSGTALANALPAVVEADSSQVPLILLTADRPPELHDTGANQTIHQPGIFASYIRWETVLPCPDTAIPPAFVLTTVDQAAHQASGIHPGPVHINCMFREPLDPVPDGTNITSLEESIQTWSESDKPYTTYTRPTVILSNDDTATLGNLLSETGRGVILIGQLNSPCEIQAAHELCRALPWPVLADITSGMRLDSNIAHAVPYYDTLLQTDAAGPLHTLDTLLHIGGAVVSKRIPGVLEAHPPSCYIRIEQHGNRLDPAHRVTHRMTCTVESVTALAGTISSNPNSEWRSDLIKVSDEIGKTIASYLEGTEITEPGIVRSVCSAIPAEHTLYLGNSMPIRDADMFASTRRNPPFVAANRGASGIDGNIATAAGHAQGTGQRVTAVLGDLAALHDINSLALLDSAPHPVILVIINNDGGGIFSFLPMAEHPAHFESHWGTPHGYGFRQFAEAFGIAYADPDSIDGFHDSYKHALGHDRSSIIEIQTDRNANSALHRDLHQSILDCLNT